MLKEECVESESVEAWCRQGRGREWSSGVAVWWSCVLIELGAVRVVEHKMKKPVSSKRFLLAATIVAIGFVIFFGQQSALPSHFEYINAKATKPDVQPLAVLDTVEEPQEIQNSSMNHKHSTVNPIDSFPAGNKSVVHMVTSERIKIPGAYKYGEGIVCDRSHSRTDICFAFGHVQMNATSSLFMLNAYNENNSGIEEKIRPYTRKWENDVMNLVNEVTLKSKLVQNNSVLNCDVKHEVPAIVFSTGGYTGNVYHEFNDGIIPLYITLQHLKREVVLVNVDCRNWWLTKYDEVLNQLTKYRVINFENETMIHCFPEVTVGVFIHDEMTIDPSLMPNNETILDFRALLDKAYRPGYRLPEKNPSGTKRPALVILVRDGSRVILNLQQLVKLAKQLGFNVTLWKPLPTTELKATYRLLNSSHVLMGVHGAALTHFLFMRPSTVFIQIIPLGTDWASRNYYGDPAQKMGLQYIGYKIGINESTLSDQYRENDTVLMNPTEIVRQGWSATKQIYLESQDVRIDLHRFKDTLMDAKRRAIRFIRQQYRKGHNG